MIIKNAIRCNICGDEIESKLCLPEQSHWLIHKRFHLYVHADSDFSRFYAQENIPKVFQQFELFFM